MPRPDPQRDLQRVSASDLAQLGCCERMVHFDWRLGAKRSTAQRQAQARGNAAHREFYQASLDIARASQKKGRCLVATLALGECAQTQALRSFRDLFLRRTAVGRWCIGAYYRLSPSLCEVLRGHPRLLSVVRVVVLLGSRMAARAVERRLRQ